MTGAHRGYVPRAGGPIDLAVQHLIGRGWLADIDLADAIDVPIHSLLGSMTQAIRHGLIATEFRDDVRHYGVPASVGAATWISGLASDQQAMAGPAVAPPVIVPARTEDQGMQTNLDEAMDAVVDLIQRGPSPVRSDERFGIYDDGTVVIVQGETSIALPPSRAAALKEFLEMHLP